MVEVTQSFRAPFDKVLKGHPALLRGAVREAAEVVAAEAAYRSESSEVSAGLSVRTKRQEPHRMVGAVLLRGVTRRHTQWLQSRANWLEYGTSPHFITVDDGQRGGRGVGRINMQVREAGGDGSLVIGGQFVGATVFHPGARPSPFMRPALDTKRAEAIAAAQRYISTRLARGGFPVVDELEVAA